MKLHPQQAPLYGQCSTQRHLTSTLRVSHDTLQALCPAHDCSEVVQITLCSLRRPVSGAPDDDPGPAINSCVAPRGQQCFCFVQDLAFDMAQFLVSTAGREDGLEGALQLDDCLIPSEECERLDEALAAALHYLTLPPGGNRLEPRETLLHFAARRGLSRVAGFLLEQPAAGEALRLANRQGHTPAELAVLRTHTHLFGVLTHQKEGGGSGQKTPDFQRGVELLRHGSRRLRAEVSPAHFLEVEEGEREETASDLEVRVTRVKDWTPPPGGYETDMGVPLSSQSSVTSDSAELPSEEGRAEEEEERAGRCDKRVITGGGDVMREMMSERTTAPSLDTHMLRQQKQESAAAEEEEELFLDPSLPETQGGTGSASDRTGTEPGERLHSSSGAQSEAVEARGAETAAGSVAAPAAEREPEPDFEAIELATELTAHHEDPPAACPETPGSSREDEQNPGTEPDHLDTEEEEEHGEVDEVEPSRKMKTAVVTPTVVTSTENTAPDPPLKKRLEITESTEVLAPGEPTEGSGSHPSGFRPGSSRPGGSDPSGSHPSVSRPGSSILFDASEEQEHTGSQVTDEGEDAGTTSDREELGPLGPEDCEDEADIGGGSSSESPEEEMLDPDSESAVVCEDGENGPGQNQEDGPMHRADVSMVQVSPYTHRVSDAIGCIGNLSWQEIHRDGESTHLPVHSSSCHGTLGQPAAGSSNSQRSLSKGESSQSVSLNADSFPEAQPGNDVVFGKVSLKGEEVLTGGDSASDFSSLSSTDDPAEAPGVDGQRGPQGPSSAGPPGGEADDEAKDRNANTGPEEGCEADGDMNHRSYSLEGLSGEGEGPGSPSARGPGALIPPTRSWQEGEQGGGGPRVSLGGGAGHWRGAEQQKSKTFRPLRHSCPPMSLPLTKSVSMVALSQRDLDVRLRQRRRISVSFNLSPIVAESKPPLLYEDTSSSDDEDNLSMRPFSSASCSLAYSISEEDPGSLRGDSDGRSVTKVGRTFSYLKNKMSRKSREKEKKTVNGHVFSPTSLLQATLCIICSKNLSAKDVFNCTHCNAFVHKGCIESLPACLRVKIKYPKQQLFVPDSSSFPVVTLRTRAPGMRDRPWSAILSPEEHPFLGPSPVFEDMPGHIKGLRYLSQSTDSLSRTKQATESMESLIDEGTEMMDDRQLMGDLEAEVKELEADSWTFTVDHSVLDSLSKDQTKRQDVIYELMQTEMHHVRTLRIMSEVYAKGLLRDTQLEQAGVDRLFPGLDRLLELHTLFLTLLLDRRRRCGGGSPDAREGGAMVHRVGDLLLAQFSGASGEEMRRAYGRFCGSHNEAVNFYKDLLNKDKRFQVLVKKKMSSSIVRRLGIPECILLVTQRITKYPVLIQRILQHTDESDEDHGELSQALGAAKATIAAVDTRVSQQEKRRRLVDVHARTDSKATVKMRSGQMFGREDLARGRRLLLHEGPLQLKNSQGRMKDVLALLLSDVVVFLQEKDQRYSFASLDQRSTVLSLQKLIVREVANEERGIFLISAGADRPEMLEAVAGSREERNTWMQLIQDATDAVEREDDEGIPSETEDDKRQMENKAKEMREALRQRDIQIVSLLEQKVQLFREMCECGGAEGPGDTALFRASSGLQPPRGEPIILDALREVETLQDLVNAPLGVVPGGGAVCLPRRAETFAGFDSRKKSQGGGVEAYCTSTVLFSRCSTVCISYITCSAPYRLWWCSRIASWRTRGRRWEKQRSVERRRQELASLHREQAAHVEERRHREKEWDVRDQQLTDREVLLRVQEEEANQRRQSLDEENQEFQLKKEQYQRDLERLRDAQRRLDRDREGVQRDLDRLAQTRMDQSASGDPRPPAMGGSGSLEQCGPEPRARKESLVRLQAPASDLPPAPSKPKGRNLNPFSSSGTSLRGGEGQVAGRLLQLAKNKDKEKKEKKEKKKKKGGGPPGTDSQNLNEAQLEGEVFFC
ncbi:hypothetical protein NHX12_005867 [Muraenolepis orangiensis]|uniref:A-kinase anchor protein 13 n=1 Tax=Muraenolepis orangiensis TaxID=630683 RepID=A0A9Q0IDA7_9TELE|nr:hypothetical protein NHX12_005867 [Muraenolepis orangiensis]